MKRVPAPLVAAALPVAQSAVKVLSTDIVTVEGKVFRRIRKKVPLERDGKILLTPKGRVRYTRLETLEPVDVSLHANPIGITALVLGGALAAIGLFGRVKVGVLGIGEVELYKGPLADEFDAFKEDWKERHRKPSPGERTKEEIRQEQTRKDCLASHTRFNYLQRQGRAAEAEVVKQDAAKVGCLWAQG